MKNSTIEAVSLANELYPDSSTDGLIFDLESASTIEETFKAVCDYVSSQYDSPPGHIIGDNHNKLMIVANNGIRPDEVFMARNVDA